MHKYIMFGPQGSGKSTQSRMLSQQFDFVHISIGEIFRWHISQRTKLASRVKRILAEGGLVPDEITMDVVRDRLREHDWNYGFVLDGFPRTRAQAEFLRESWNVDKVIHLDVPDEVVFERVMARAKAGLGSGYTKRADDNPESLRTRIAEYHRNAKPLLDLYRKHDMLIHVEGTLPISQVYSRIAQSLRLNRQRTVGV